jgi:hypothetical protein
MQANNADDEELSRKRQRNRVAQQKYRRRLKLHIDDLERKAAVADRLVAGRETLLPDNLMESIDDFTDPQLGAPGTSMAQPIDVPPRVSPNTATSTSRESMASLPRGAAFSGSDCSGLHEDDIFRGFSISTDELSNGSKTFFSTTMGHMDKIEALEAVHFTTSPEVDALQAITPTRANHLTTGKVGSLPDSLPEMPPGLDHGGLEARVDYVLRSVEKVGFPTLDSFMSSYYTASFRDRSTVQKAQETSRSRGLPIMLDEIRAQSEQWSAWQSRAYTDSTVRSAASMIADDFERLTKKRYQCEKELHEALATAVQDDQADMPRSNQSPAMHQLYAAAGELKKTLRNELPNIDTLTSTLSSDELRFPRSMRVELLLATIKVVTAAADKPLQEAANWAYLRTITQASSTSSRSRNSDDFDGGSSMSSN